VKALIRESKIYMIPSAIETGAKDGMVTMDRALFDLYKEGLITKESMTSVLTDMDYTKMKG
jgi:twitching motility protein PilT